jgi:outer membrane protein OmpA-like peptidoglycan-associated protein
MPINFDLGSARVSAASILFLEQVATFMHMHPAIRVSVQGHTDITGDARRNAVLSWERAVAVYRVLVERMGIEPHRLLPIGKGQSEPMPGSQPWDGRNRRVQFGLI